jgi:hypothetical protein
MKKIKDWTRNLRHIADCETPFKEIDFMFYHGKPTVRMYWTKGGAYGCQVRTFIYWHNGEPAETHVTNGCGYCKETESIQIVLDRLKLAMDAEHFKKNDKYHVGGNYFRVN